MIEADAVGDLEVIRRIERDALVAGEPRVEGVPDARAVDPRGHLERPPLALRDGAAVGPLLLARQEPGGRDAPAAGPEAGLGASLELVLAADSFSGYCVLRSEAFKQELRDRQIKLAIADDKADYAARLDALRTGKLHLKPIRITEARATPCLILSAVVV